jgi:hypothetical protein
MAIQRIIESEGDHESERLKIRIQETELNSQKLASDLAEANERASAADNELKVRADEADKAISAANARAEIESRARISIQGQMAPRRIPPHDRQHIVRALSQFAGQPAEAYSIMGDSEAQALAHEFSELLHSAGWSCAVGTGQVLPAGIPPIGVQIQINPCHSSRESVPPGTAAILHIVDQLSLTADKKSVFTSPDVPTNTIRLLVGTKLPMTAHIPTAPRTPNGFVGTSLTFLPPQMPL